MSALDDISRALASAPAFTPLSGRDAEQYIEAIVSVLQTLGTRVSADLATIAELLPQHADSLGALSVLGEVITAVSAQAGQQVHAWSQSAAWVWHQS